MKKLIWLLALMMLFSGCDHSFEPDPTGPTPAITSYASGSNEDFSWELKDGVLSVSGSGVLTKSFTKEWQDLRYNIKGLELDEGITGIGDGVFEDLRCIEFISLHEGITKVGHNAFRNCNGRLSVLPASLTHIWDGAFSGCRLADIFVIPETVEYIGEEAFSMCADGQNVVFEGIPEMEGRIFAQCSDLISVSLPDDMDVLPWGMFSDCWSLEVINIPASVTEIPTGFMNNCESLKDLRLHEGIVSIQGSAFAGCHALTEVSIPKSVTHIGEQAFAGCMELTGFKVDPENEYYVSDAQGALYTADQTQLLQVPLGNGGVFEVPATVVELKAWAFANCRFSEIVLQNGLRKMGYGVFTNCAELTKLVIPDGVETYDTGYLGFEEYIDLCPKLTSLRIGRGARQVNIRHCPALEEISIPVSVLQIWMDTFEECENFRRINYEGTQEQWEQIYFHGDGSVFQSAEVVFEYEYE